MEGYQIIILKNRKLSGFPTNVFQLSRKYKSLVHRELLRK